MSPSGVFLPASWRKASWKWLKFGRSGTSSISDFTRAAKAARPFSPPCASRSSISFEIFMRTRISCATSLRVLLMFDWSRTELREVLLNWMSYSSAISFLNCVPS